MYSYAIAPQQALAGLTAADPEVQADTLRAIFRLPAMPELYAVTVSNLDSPNESVVFLSLNTLVNKYPQQLQRDASELIPKLISLLPFANGPVIDRGSWALTVVGDQSIPALMEGIEAAGDEQHWAFLWALGRNGHARRHAAAVLATFRTALHAPQRQIQLVALEGLINFMRPLTPEGQNFVGYDFMTLLPEMQQVGKTLLEQAQIAQNESEVKHLQWCLSFLS